MNEAKDAAIVVLETLPFEEQWQENYDSFHRTCVWSNTPCNLPTKYPLRCGERYRYCIQAAKYFQSQNTRQTAPGTTLLRRCG